MFEFIIVVEVCDLIFDVDDMEFENDISDFIFFEEVFESLRVKRRE